MSAPRLRIAVIAFSLASLTPHAFAGLVTWMNTSGGDWATPGNWSTGVVPTSADDVHIDTAGTYTVTISTGTTPTVNSLTLGAASGTQTLAAATALTINNPSTVNANGVLTINNRITTTGTLSVSGTMNLNGLLTGTGATTINGAGTLNLQNGAQIEAATLNVSGTMIWASTNNIDVGQGSTITINSGGLFDIRNDYNVYIFGGPPNPTWNNAGTIRKSAGAGITSLGVGSLTSTGSIQAHAATLQLAGGGTIGGTIDTAAGAALEFRSNSYTLNGGTTFTGAGFSGPTGATITLAGNVTAQNFSQTGGLINGTGSLTVTGTFNDSGGQIGGIGSAVVLDIPVNALWNINTSSASPFFEGATANIDGTAVWTGNGDFDVSQGAVMNIHAGALFDAKGDGPVYIFGGNPAPTWNVAGTLRKSGGTATSAFGAGALNNTGTVLAQTGTLEFSGGGTLNGNFNAAAGATINLRSGTFTAQTGTTFTGAGFCGTTGTLSLAGNITAVNFQQTGGTITGTGTLTVSNIFNDNGGLLSGSGAVLNIASGAVWNIVGVNIAAATVNVDGTVVWTGTRSLDGSQAATINIHSGGLWDVRTDEPMYIFGGGTPPTWNNAGTIRKSATLGTASLGVGTVNNSGTIQVLAGQLNTATLNNSGTLLIGPAILAPTNFIQTAAGKILIQAGGVVPGQEIGQVAVGSAATLAGTLSLALTNGFVPSALAALPVVTYASHSGTIGSFGGLSLPNGETLVPVYTSTNLSLQVTHADLALSGGGSVDPVLAGGTLTYNYTLTNNGPFNATGVSFSDTIPTGATLTSATASQGSCSGSLPVVCTIGALAKGASVTVTLATKAPATTGTIANNGSVALNEPDPFVSDNTITTYTADVGSASDLAITGLNPAMPHNGGTRTITISGQNFDSRAAVSLSHGTRPGPNPGPVFGTILSNTPNAIQATFDLRSEDILDDWDVIVQNGDGRSATRPMTIIPDLLFAAGNLAGTDGIPIGSFRTNYLETLNFGNDDGLALLKIAPPLPGTVQLKIGPLNSPLWDSTTDPDPTEAMIFAFVPAAQVMRLKMNWMIPAANVLFAGLPGEVTTYAVRTENGPIQVKIGDTTVIIWEGKEIAREQAIGKIKDILVSQTVCTSLGKYLAGAVSDQEMTQAIDQAITALNPEGSTGKKLLETIGDKLGGLVPGFDQVHYAAQVGNCLGTILQAIDVAYGVKVKRVADNVRNDPRARGLAFDEIDRRQGFGSLTPLGARASLLTDEALAKPACRPPGVAARTAARVQVRGPWDPNDKTTKTFVPCQRSAPTSTTCVQYFTSPTDPIEYTIEFQNLPAATAPATNVTITDVLSANLDPTTLHVVSTSSPATFSSSISGQTATFTFTNINLPPDTNPPNGEGFVRFSVRPVANLAIGTTITNTAAVVFDSNPPINTPTLTYVISDDQDRDGVMDMVEDGAPNAGDGDGDGVADKLESNVTSIPLITGGGGYITVAVSGGCTQIEKVQHLVGAGNQPDTDFSYPNGLLSFTLPCPTATVTIYNHTLGSVAGASVRRYGPTTPADMTTATWYTQPGATFGSATVGAASVPTATFTVTDGAPGDDTAADGSIVLTVGVGMPSSTLAFSASGFTASAANAGTATITVTRSYNSSGATAVSYTTADGSAVAGTNYTAASGTLNWADGDLTPKTFTVPFFKSTTTSDQTVNLILSNPTGGGVLGLPRQATLSLIAEPNGDSNGDGSVTAADIFYLINYLFIGGHAPIGPADVNGDGAVNAADIFYLINYLFAGGPAPK